MYRTWKWISGVLAVLQVCTSENISFRGPPLVQGKPVLLDSFIPASMQIMAHLTDLMKYDLRPTTGPTTTTTSTVRPTPSHKPGLFAPVVPPGPEAYFAKTDSIYEEYFDRLQNSGYNYFDRYRYPVDEEVRFRNLQDLEGIPDDIDLLVGQGTGDLLRLVNRIDDDDARSNDEQQLVQFSQRYDVSNLKLYLRQKKVPPTKAYVTLLSLYDQLNKESKKLGLNKYQGYAPAVLQLLVDTTSGTSANQLKIVLSKVLEHKDTKQMQIIIKIENLIKDLEQDNSYINDALRYIPPLQFTL